MWMDERWRGGGAAAIVFSRRARRGSSGVGTTATAAPISKHASPSWRSTMARKGNRKVSVEVYGLVNQALLGWYDGKEADVYEVTNDNQRTRFGFKGKAKIDKDWEAGFKLEIGIRTANSKRRQPDRPQGRRQPGRCRLRSARDLLVPEGEAPRHAPRRPQHRSDRQDHRDQPHADGILRQVLDVEDTGLGMLLRSAVNGRLTSSGISWRRLIGDSGDQPGEGDAASMWSSTSRRPCTGFS